MSQRWEDDEKSTATNWPDVAIAIVALAALLVCCGFLGGWWH